MNVTAGFHIDKSGKSYDKVVYHNERKKRIFNDKNIKINWNLTPYNQVGKLNDADKLLEDNAKSYVNQYNKRQIKQGHRKRCYSSVHQYIQKRGKKAKRRGIIWLGNTKFRKKFETKAVKLLKKKNPNLTKKQIILYLRTKVEPKILKDEILRFNKNHQHIKICRYAIHVDEGFIHAHVELVALPSYTNTKNPRPSFSMSKAIREEYPNAKHTFHTKTKYYGKYKSKKKILHGTFTQADGRKASSLLDDDVGKSLIHFANLEAGKIDNFELTRTGHASSLSGARYKHYAIESDKDDEETSKASTMASKVSSAQMSSNSLSKANHASYNDLATSLQSVMPNLTGDNDNQLTSSDYFSIATGQRNVGFNDNHTWLTGVSALSYAISSNLSRSKQSTVASYRDEAILEAEPRISKAIDNGKSSASESASATVSASVSSTVSSINDSIVSSNSEWQSNINNSLSVSASASVKASAKAKKEVLASKSNAITKENNKMIHAKFRMLKSYSSIHYGYRKQGNYRKPTNSEYSSFAKNGATLRDSSHVTGDQLISIGMSSLASKASSANNEYNSINDKNNSLKAKNSSYTTDNNNLQEQIGHKQKELDKLNIKSYIKKDNFNQDIKNELINLGMSKPSAMHYYTANKIHINKKPLFKTLLDKVHSVVNNAKSKAKKIIYDAKQRAKDWLGINNNGYTAMQNYIYNNDPMAQHNPNQDLQAKGYYDPADLHGNDFLTAYNNTADYVHNQKVKKWQRQHNGYQPPTIQ